MATAEFLGSFEIAGGTPTPPGHRRRGPLDVGFPTDVRPVGALPNIVEQLKTHGVSEDSIRPIREQAIRLNIPVD